MAFLRQFDDDVFISYAWKDDEPVIEGEKGWVTHFHRDLRSRLAQWLGAEAKIWRDEHEIKGNDPFADKIKSQLPRTAVLISVISPLYFHSEWCRAEFDAFLASANEDTTLPVPVLKRLFKVVKTPVEGRIQPPEMQAVTGYEFYELDGKTAYEYNREFGEKWRYKYADELNRVAYDLAEFLRSLSGVRQAEPLGTIYLAETTSDLRAAREEVKRDLIHRGYAVLPDRPLAQDGANFRDQVRESLSKCSLSIHLVGERYGIVPEGETQSLTELQADLAAERCEIEGFRRVLWMPMDLKTGDARQQALINHLENDSDAQKKTDVLKTRLEDLKSLVEDVFQRKAVTPPVVKPPVRRGPLRIYIIADQQDLEQGLVAPLEDYLFNQGYEVICSLAGPDEKQTREDHVENLRLCDASIIFYGTAGEFWLRAKLNDFRKVLDARVEPVLSRCIYIAAPETDQKRRLQTREALLVRNFHEFSGDALQPFLEQLRRKPE
ncbi:toll/interleukin-1 receptor domain-containing protein [Paracidobacterium acidisoli]|uniref:Toll/interleukin-1 receptor domain-containing protein n=1 Tax=Paracidobacterium acidisoli TaxID=2303751 RepID=A0A372IJC7_9BACT|nr:toll/interleukin-1 receptor domain-containing protein [Paracidobacterium acidisoli]MBT9333227.1 toll/interleukin-1 receptor domain-containing protein [Paracidobacterium acidisoli]